MYLAVYVGALKLTLFIHKGDLDKHIYLCAIELASQFSSMYGHWQHELTFMVFNVISHFLKAI